MQFDGDGDDERRVGDGDGRHDGSVTVMMAMDGAAAMGGKEEIMAGQGVHQCLMQES